MKESSVYWDPTIRDHQSAMYVCGNVISCECLHIKNYICMSYKRGWMGRVPNSEFNKKIVLICDSVSEISP